MAKHSAAKPLISGIALVFAVIAAFEKNWSNLEITPTVLGLLGLAILPWLGSLLDVAELPGGWKLEFRKVEAEQHRQRADIEALKFLVSGFVTGVEFAHLQKLAVKQPFPFTGGPETEFFLNELRRLRSLGLISNHEGKGIRALRSGGGDINAYFFITPRGQEYLRIRSYIEQPDTGRSSLNKQDDR
jgi:hypothetical protein